MAVPCNRKQMMIKGKAQPKFDELPQVADDVTVRFHMRDGNEPLPDRKLKITNEILIHRMPFLLPFGMTTIRIDVGHREWCAKCGSFRIEGNGADFDKIVKMFVTMVTEEIAKAKVEISQS